MSATNSIFSTRVCAANKLSATIVVAASILISACSTAPLLPYTEDTPAARAYARFAGRHR